MYLYVVQPIYSLFFLLTLLFQRQQEKYIFDNKKLYMIYNIQFNESNTTWVLFIVNTTNTVQSLCKYDVITLKILVQVINPDHIFSH